MAAIAKVADRANLNSNTGATVFDLVLASLTIGNKLIIRVAADNAGTSGAASTLTVTNQSGTAIDVATDVTYTQLNDPGAASAGVTCHVIVAAITATSGTVRLTFGNTVVAAIQAEEWSGIHATAPVVGTPVGANGVASATLASTADAHVAFGNLAYGCTAIEGPSADTYTNDADTTGGSWTALTKRATTNATADLNMCVAGAFKLVTLTGPQTHNPTNSVARDSAGLIIEFQQAWDGNPVTSIGWDKCFYAEGAKATLGADGAAVERWEDECSVATNDVVQATGTAQPVHRSTGGGIGQPCVEADGGDQLLNATVPTVAQPMSIFCIGKADNADTNTRVLASGGTSSDPKFETITGMWAMNCGDPALSSGVTDDALWHYWMAFFQSSTVGVLEMDGTQLVTGDPGAGNSTVGTALFDKASPGEPWDGKLYFSAEYLGDLRAHPNFAALETWAATKMAAPAVQATMATPLGALTSTISATVKVPATMSTPLGALTSTMAATVKVPATMAATLGALTSTMTAKPKKIATMSTPLGGLTTTMAAAPKKPATMATPLGALTTTMGATVHERVEATMATPLGALTSTMAGVIHARITAIMEGGPGTAALVDGVWDFEGGVQGWFNPAFGFSSLDASTAFAHSGTGSLRHRRFILDTYGTTESTDFAVDAGREYIASLWSYADTKTADISIKFRWKNASHVFLSESALSTTTDTLGSWTLIATALRKAPPGAAFASLYVTQQPPGPAGEFHYYDDAMIQAGTGLGPLTSTMLGKPKKIATMSTSLGGLTSTVSGTVKVPTTMATPLGALTSTMVAKPKKIATMATSLGALTSTMVAKPKKIATMATPLGALTTTMGAVVHAHITATMATLLGALTSSMAATAKHPATMATPLGALTTTVNAKVKVPAILSAVLGGLISTMAGTVSPPAATHQGTLSTPLGGLTTTMSGTIHARRVATMATPLGAVTSAMGVTLRHPATMNTPLGPLSSAVTGAKIIHLASFSITLGSLTASMGAVLRQYAAMSMPLGGLTATMFADVIAGPPSTFENEGVVLQAKKMGVILLRTRGSNIKIHEPVVLSGKNRPIIIR